MKKYLCSFLLVINSLLLFACNSMNDKVQHQHEFLIACFVCGLLYLAILILYLIVITKINNKEMGNITKVKKMFLIFSSILTTIICLVLINMYKNYSNGYYLISPYIILALNIILLNLINKNNNYSKSLLKSIIIRLVILIFLQSVLNCATCKLIDLMNLSNNILSAICSTTLIGLLIYTICTYVKFYDKFNIKWIDATLITFIFIYFLITMVSYLGYDKNNEIGCILVLLSLIMALFQNINYFVDYFTLPIKQ